MSEGEIFSSTGGMGRDVRQDNRLYENADMYEMRPIMVAERFADLREDPRSETENISRWVLRGVVNDETMAEIQADRYGMRQNLEVALPLAELGRPGWLVYLGENTTERTIGVNIPDPAIVVASSRTSPGRAPAIQLEDATDNGYEIRTMPTSDDAEQLGDNMWIPTFGWGGGEIEAIIDQIQGQHELSLRSRDTFFAGLYSGGILVGAAMAETLRMPTPRGTLPLVESTEWCMSPDQRGQGLMSVVLAALNAQAIRTFNARHESPLIYAETNQTSRADKAGYMAGFQAPSPAFADQTLPAHVTVNDGVEQTGLRNFTFTRLPEAAFHEDTGYSARQIDHILDNVTTED